MTRNNRKTIRVAAGVANAVILVPYALFALLAAFSGDYDPWPLSGLGALYLVAGVLTTIALLRPARGAVLLVITGCCSLLQIALLVRGVFEVLDKPDAIPWIEEAFFSIIPLVAVPLLSLLALTTQDRPLTVSQCPQCGYNMTGLKRQRCPECGHEREDALP